MFIGHLLYFLCSLYVTIQGIKARAQHFFISSYSQYELNTTLALYPTINSYALATQNKLESVKAGQVDIHTK